MRDGWTETTLGEVADVNMGQSPPGDTYNTDGIGMPFMQGSAEFGEHYPEPVKFCSAPAKIAEVGDLLLSVRAPVGDSNFANQRIAIGRGLATVRAKRGADTNFLRLVIQLNTAGLLATSGTGMFSSITGKNLREFGVNLPPLVEQKRIVDVVSSVDAYIDALQQQADTTRTARNAVLHELLSAGGDDWTETTLGEIAEASWGNTSVTKKQYKESGYTAFSASGPDGFVDWFEHDEKGVVLSAIGALCGKTWLADGKWTPIKNTIWIKSKSEECLTEYLFLVSKIPDLWPIRGQAQPFISLGDVRQVDLSLPPVTKQMQIVEIVSSMDEVIQSTEQAVADAKNLRSGLLSDLLSGEHKIPESYDKFVGVV
jgi:type I restriction enzyme S subunit